MDHQSLVAEFPLRIYEQGRARAYAYLYPTGGAHLLAATDPAAATEVLWAALAHSDPEKPFDLHILTTEQSWAVDVGLAAGMQLYNRGFLALRSMPPPTPYIPSGYFL